MKLYETRARLISKLRKKEISKVERRELDFLNDFVEKLEIVGRIITSHMSKKVYDDFIGVMKAYKGAEGVIEEEGENNE